MPRIDCFDIIKNNPELVSEFISITEDMPEVEQRKQAIQIVNKLLEASNESLNKVKRKVGQKPQKYNSGVSQDAIDEIIKKYSQPEQKETPQAESTPALRDVESTAKDDKTYLSGGDEIKNFDWKNLEVNEGDLFRGVEENDILSAEIPMFSENPMVAIEYARAEKGAGKYIQMKNKFNENSKLQRFKLKNGAKVLDTTKSIDEVNELKRILGKKEIDEDDYKWRGGWKVWGHFDYLTKEQIQKLKESGYDAIKMDETDRDTGIGKVDGSSYAIINKDAIEVNSLKPKSESLLSKEQTPAKESKEFSIDGKNIFYHASDNKRVGNLKPSNAPQFGTGIYLSTNKKIVEDEFGDKNTTSVKINISNPVYTNTKQWNEVVSLAIEKADRDYGSKKELKLEEDETYFRYDKDNLSEIDEIPSKFISDAAKELGYDAIIDKGSIQYENEVVVLDDSKIIYVESLLSKEQTKKESVIREIEDYTKAKEERKANVLKHHQYDLKVNFLQKNNLPKELIDDKGFNEAWDSGVLDNANGIGLNEVAPNLVESAIKNPKPFIEAYKKVNEKFGEKNGYIKDTESAKKEFKSLLSKEQTPAKEVAPASKEQIESTAKALEEKAKTDEDAVFDLEGDANMYINDLVGKEMNNIISDLPYPDEVKSAIRKHFSITRNGEFFSSLGAERVIKNNDIERTKSFVKRIGAELLKQKFEESTKEYSNELDKLNENVNQYFQSLLDAEEKGENPRINNDISKIVNILYGVQSKYEQAEKNIPNNLSEAYHKAKADGSNPELVKAVESLLSNEQTPQAGSGDVGGEQPLKETPNEGKVNLSTSAPKQSITKKAFTALTTMLKKAFPKVEFIGEKEAREILGDKGIKVNEMRTSDGNVFGFEYKGKIFLDETAINADTPIHEVVGHYGMNIIDAMAKGGDEKAQAIIAKGFSLLQAPEGKAVLDEIKANPAYSNLSLMEKKMEALATIIGREGANMFTEGTRKNTFASKVKDFIKSFYDYIRTKVPTLKDKTIKQIVAMDNKEFIRAIVGDAFRGEIVQQNNESLSDDKVMLQAQKEADSITLKYNGKGQHLAPNGKPSNLTEQQAKIVRTEAFKNWFGDWENDPKNASKVVDANGEPLVVYHGGLDKITEFDERFGGDTTANNEHGAFYFSDNKEVAEDYSRQSFIRRFEGRDREEIENYNEGYFTEEELDELFLDESYLTESILEEWFDNNEKANVVFAFLNIRNPLVDKSQKGKPLDTEKTQRQVGFAKKGIDSEYEFEEYYPYNEETEEYSEPNLDGVVIEDVIDDIGYRSNQIQTEYIALTPNQIKSADGTNTTFNPNTNDIRFQASPKTDLQEAERKLKEAWGKYLSNGISFDGMAEAEKERQLIVALLGYLKAKGIDIAKGIGNEVRDFIKNKFSGVTDEMIDVAQGRMLTDYQKLYDTHMTPKNKEILDGMVSQVKSGEMSFEDFINTIDGIVPNERIKNVFISYVNEQIDPLDGYVAVDEEIEEVPESPKTETSKEEERAFIGGLLARPINRKNFPNIVGDNKTDDDVLKRITAVTQEDVQDRKVMVDTSYVRVALENIKEIALQNANALYMQFGEDWQNKVMDYLSDYLNAANPAQAIGILNVISTDVQQKIEKSQSPTERTKLFKLQDKADELSILFASQASLGINARKILRQFAQGGNMSKLVLDKILTEDTMQTIEEINRIAASKPTNEELNNATLPVQVPQTPKSRIQKIKQNVKAALSSKQKNKPKITEKEINELGRRAEEERKRQGVQTKMSRQQIAQMLKEEAKKC